MPNVVFVAPFFLETTVRFLDAVASLPGVRCGLVSQDPVEKLPPRLRSRLASHRRVGNAVDPQQIADATRSIAAEWGSGVDRLLGALEQLQEPLAEVRGALGIPGMRLEAARNFRDKARMKDVLAKHGVPCARHARIHDAGAAIEFAGRVGYPLVLKPVAGAGAKATYRVTDARELQEALAAVRPSAERPAVLEEFVTGQEFSFDAVSIRGRAVWHSLTHYLPAPLHVLDNPWIQWCVLLPREIDDPRYDDIRPVAAKALQALGMDTGLAHMEWFRRPEGGVMISEVGARPGGAQITSIISWAHDVDFYKAWARLVVYEQFEVPKRKYSAGCAYLRAQGEGKKIVAVHGLERTLQALGPMVVEVKRPNPGAPPSSSYEGDGFVILRHPETAKVEAGLRQLVTDVRVELG
ncbi:MAG: ATP-grasp domain-containing protein [Acidobacteria bacterium]|nr:ATP-grasp domain-containing protein [Acidobacteriota bacterium]